MNKITQISIATVLLVFSLGNANAATVNFQFTGDVIDGDLDFGLVGGDTIIVSGQYNNSALDGFGDGIIDFTSGSGNTFTIFAGTQTYTEMNDKFFASFIEIAGFNTLLDFDFLAEAGINGATVGFSSFGTSFDTISLGGDLFGDWNTTIVPVPAAAWLFGSGLLGLIGIARRKTA